MIYEFCFQSHWQQYLDSIAIPIKAVKKDQVGTGRYEQSLGEHGVLVSFYCNVFISSSVTQVEYSRARS